MPIKCLILNPFSIEFFASSIHSVMSPFFLLSCIERSPVNFDADAFASYLSALSHWPCALIIEKDLFFTCSQRYSHTIVSRDAESRHRMLALLLIVLATADTSFGLSCITNCSLEMSCRAAAVDRSSPRRCFNCIWKRTNEQKREHRERRGERVEDNRWP